MLQTIKDYIQNLPDKDFGQHFQEYVEECQDKIISNDISFAKSSSQYQRDLKDILSGINCLTEELKKL